MEQTYITPQTRELINIAVDSAVKRAFEEFKKISKNQSENRDEDFLSAVKQIFIEQKLLQKA